MDEVFDLLLQENNQNNRTVLSVLHDINLASMYLNRLIFLKEGRLVAEGVVSAELDDYKLRLCNCRICRSFKFKFLVLSL